MGIANTSIPAMITWAWGGFAVATMAIGAMLRETRYRWAALGIFLVAFVRAFAYDLRVLPAYQSLPVFLCMSAVMLLITWLYARRSGRSGDVDQSPGDPPCA
jgi:hypothetical protein